MNHPAQSSRRALLLVAAAALLLSLAVRTAGWDVPCFEAVRPLLLAMGSPVFWSSLTALGDALVAPLLLLPFAARQPRLLVAAGWSTLVATLVSHGLKAWVQSPRPPAVLAIETIGPRLLAGSWPSGHTTTVFTVLGVLLLGQQRATRGALVVAAAAALLVGLSRIAVGAHWPGDVLAGIACGLASATAGWWLAQRPPAIARLRVRQLWLLVLLAVAISNLAFHDTGYPLGRVLQVTVALMALACWPAVWRRTRQAAAEDA